MYWYSDHNNVSKTADIKVYMDAADYGIRCNYDELEEVLNNVKKYLKKTKVRADGLWHDFASRALGSPVTKETCFSEWKLRYSMFKAGTLKPEQGMMWEFVIRPNRHCHIQESGERRDCWAAPDHKEFDYIVELRKQNYYFLEDGKRVETDEPEIRKQREDFFDGLLESVGFELVKIYEYEPEEEPYGCRECGTWYRNSNNRNISEPYKREK